MAYMDPMGYGMYKVSPPNEIAKLVAHFAPITMVYDTQMPIVNGFINQLIIGGVPHCTLQ